MHALLRNAWGDAQHTVCISHMRASDGVPPLLLTASWLPGPPTGEPAKGSSGSCALQREHCAGARAAATVLSTGPVDASSDTADSDVATVSSDSSVVFLSDCNAAVFEPLLLLF